MPITIDIGEFKALDRRSGDRRDIEDGGALDAETVMIQFVCSTDGDGVEHDPAKEPDERVRPEHAALHGTVWRIDDANAPVPPLDYGCRCAIRYVAKPGSYAAAAGGLPEAPSEPVESPSDAYRTWLDKNAPGWQEVADTMAKAPEGEELAAGYQKAAELKIPGDRRAIVRMAGRVDPGAAPTPPPAAAPPGPAAPAEGQPPTRPDWLPAGAAKDEGAAMSLRGVPPASASAAAPPPPAPIAPAAVEQAERWIAARTTERNVIFDAAGNLVEAQEGNAVSAPVSGMAQIKGQGGVLTHNHPLPAGEMVAREWYNPLSDADLALALTMKLQAIRAVTPNGLVYQAGPPAGGWTGKNVGNLFGHEANRRRVQSWLAAAAIDPLVTQRLQAAVAAGHVAADATGLLRHHLVLERLAETGKITYTVGRYAT